MMHYRGTTCLIAASILGAFLSSHVLAGEVQHKASQEQAGQRLVLLAPSAPFIIELILQVDRGDFRTATTDYIERLFQSLDGNQDHFIDLKEMKNVPAFGIKLLDQGSPTERLKMLDTIPADNRLSLGEFASYIHRAQGTAFRIAGAPARSSQVIELFRKLDQNRDGSVSDEEFSTSSKTLFMYDRDEDEVLNLVELRPFMSDPNAVIAQPVSRQSIETPFRRLDNDRSINAAIDELFKKYVEYQNTGKDAISLDCFRQGESDFAAIQDDDLNSDGFFSRDELFAYLQNPVVNLRLQVSLPRQQSFRPSLTILDKHSSRVSDIKINSRSKLEFRIDSLLLELRVKSSRHMFADTVRFYQTRFRVVDGDKNGYLSVAEFAQLNLPDTDYKKVDKNKDEMLTVDELTKYLMKDTAAVQDQVVMTVDNDGKSLFEILDTDLDRRLSPRELKKSLQRVREFDGNRDQSLDHSELRGHFKITVELGKPELFVFDPRVNAMSMNQNRTVQRTVSGPRWFQRMDRNRDGDISRREFLFDPSLFDLLDRDHDQLISSAEADAYQQVQSSTQTSSSNRGE
jgi:Ca2+-binding EF-hand superfamily protein